MKTKQKEFDKAVKKKWLGNFIGTIVCAYFSFIFMLAAYTFYSLDLNLTLIFIMLGVFATFGFLINFIELIKFAINPNISESYHLCKRCKALVKKDKVFCSECMSRIKRAVREVEDKDYFKEYKKIIKQEKKK